MRHSYVYDEAYAEEADTHVRRTVRPSWILRWLGVPLLCAFVATSVAMREWKLVAVGVLVAAFQLLAIPLHRRSVRAAARKEPNFGHAIASAWSAEGVEVRAPTGTSLARWSTFTRAVFFEKGVVLFEGPALARWLPHAALAEGSREEFEALVRRHVADVVGARR